MLTIPRLNCPICYNELHYVLYVPPKKTKQLKCDNCKIKIIITIDKFNEIMMR